MKHFAIAFLALALVACSSDEGSQEPVECGEGEMFNPIAGACEGLTQDAGVDSDPEDMGQDAIHTPDMMADLSDMGANDQGQDMGPDLPGEACGVVVSGCDDSMACTQDSCVADVCEHVGDECGWPAEVQSMAENLTGLDRPGFGADLSGVVYNPVHPRLWVVRNNGPSRVWSLVRDAAGDWQIDAQGTDLAVWFEFGDAEAITLADWDNEFQVLVLQEGGGFVREFDFSDFTAKTELHAWDVPEILDSGAEGMTFVPDAALMAGGFVDATGQPYVSSQGMGGLVFVAHQNGGSIHVLDLNRSDDSYVYVGEYATSADESSGLEWDGSTGQLFVWHDDSHDKVEVVRLSSNPSGPIRRFDTIVTYDGPQTGLGVSTNFEGIAVEPVTECVNGKRNFYMTTDGGRGFSFFMYHDFSC